MNINDSSRKQIILREAASLFREKGYNASTLRELAKKSGIKGGSIYHHFSSKQEILYTIMNDTMAGLIRNLRETIGTGNDPVEKLRKAVCFHIEYHVTDPDATFVTDTEIRSLENGNHDRIIAQRREYENMYLQMLNDGIDRGVMKMGNAVLNCKAILQMCTGVSLWFKPGGMSIREVAGNYADFICHGVTGPNGKSG